MMLAYVASPGVLGTAGILGDVASPVELGLVIFGII